MAVASPVFGLNLDAPYVRPRQKVTEFVALGDSFTAGTGSNGLPERTGGMAERGWSSYPLQMMRDKSKWAYINGGDVSDRKEPHLTFLGHVGDIIDDLYKEQLAHSGNWHDRTWDKARGQPFGHPQLAVMTIGGNDAHLADFLNDCIYRLWRPENCQQTIRNTQIEIEDGSLEKKIYHAAKTVARAGRAQQGANPPESFQVYLVEYPIMFNSENPECNRVDWRFFRLTGSRRPLTIELRRSLNHVQEQFNDILRRVAEDLEDMGVIYVSGISKAFEGHRYCEPGQTSWRMNHRDTWFWSLHSNTENRSEGIAARGATAEDPDAEQRELDQGVIDLVFPGKNYSAANVTADSPPWTWPGAEKYPNYRALTGKMVVALGQQGQSLDGKNPNPHIMLWRPFFVRLFSLLMPFRVLRSFHPKGTGYAHFSEQIFQAIINNRDVPE